MIKCCGCEKEGRYTGPSLNLSDLYCTKRGCPVLDEKRRLEGCAARANAVAVKLGDTIANAKASVGRLSSTGSAR